MDKPSVRQADIAQTLNISRTTVARAFSGKNISPKTKKLVLSTAKKMGYVPNLAAEMLAKKGMKTVYAFIIGTIDEGYAKQMLEGIQEISQLWNGFNYHIEICVTDIREQGDKRQEQLDSFLNLVDSCRPDGIIFSALCSENLDVVSAYCRDNNIPLMTLDVEHQTDDFYHVGSNYFNLGETSAAFLARLMQFKGKILTVSYDEQYGLAAARMKGFFQHLKKHPDISCLNINVNNISYGTYLQALKEHLKVYQPDAIYALYKMDYIVDAARSIEPDKHYIMISNGINEKIESYLNVDIISGIITNNPYQLGSIAANNFFKYFYRPTEKIKKDIYIGCNIYIKENFELYRPPY